MSYACSLLATVELYLILAVSLNLLVGYTGLVSLCHAASYGVGAYAAGILMKSCGWAFLPAVGAAVLVTMLLGVVVALPSLRLRDDYFVVATLALQTITFRSLYNLDRLTGGASGLTDIPTATVAGLALPPDSLGFVAFTTVCAAVVMLAFHRLGSSPFGRQLRAIRDDDQAVAALGRNVAAFKVKAFLAGSAGAALAGALLAVRLGTLDPNQFGIAESVLVLTALVVGGSGNLVGPVVGAAAIVLLPEPLRLLGGKWAALAGELRQVMFGLLLIVLLRWRPQGLAGAYRFE
ncbi:MAG: branched-chain amino acid ABC transporter permease [Armatimonadetes bacterium]|nr:branched-chain amino acid ABC transporter permease [Armatimonadota bacterium]